MARYQIDYINSALEDFTVLKKYDQRIIFDTIEQQLLYEPTVETRNRKSLEDNALAAWELRIGQYRVFYNVSTEQVTVVIIAVGYKEHSKLYVRGEEYQL